MKPNLLERKVEVDRKDHGRKKREEQCKTEQEIVDMRQKGDLERETRQQAQFYTRKGIKVTYVKILHLILIWNMLQLSYSEYSVVQN